MSADRLYVAAKPPVPGTVKTRLARTIGAVASAELYAAFLEDLAGMIRESGIPAGWFLAPANDWTPPSLGRRQLPTLTQRGASWGERQAGLFAASTGPMVLAASDSPQLDRADLSAAFAALESADVVLGPVLDGGYYLVGMNGDHDILAPVAMSTATACAEVVAGARALGLSTHLLSPRFDVDEAPDLDRLAASRAPHLRATRAWMRGAFASSPV